MESPEPALRGLAAWTAGLFTCERTSRLLKQLENDHATLTFYFDGILEELSVAELLKKSFSPTCITLKHKS
jgi:hypothetical protein